MSYTIHEVSRSDRPAFHERILALERGIRYPLGTDRFEIDHGGDFFAFFDRLGATSYVVALRDERVAASFCGVLRQVPPRRDAPPRSIWYACDLKVHPNHRRQRLPWQLFRFGFPRKYPICSRGYGISMNPGDGAENPVVRLFRRFWIAPIQVGPTLLFYNLSMEEMERVAPAVRETRGAFSYLSLSGIKDIVLQSTGRPMPLLHVQFGPCAEQHTGPGRGTLLDGPQPDHVHMFCTPEDDPLAHRARALGLAPQATASILSHRMAGWDWSFVLTSDI